MTPIFDYYSMSCVKSETARQKTRAKVWLELVTYDVHLAFLEVELFLVILHHTR